MTLESKERGNGDCDNAADALSKMTGKPREEFDASDYEIPDFDEQEIVVKEEEPESSR
ncbi:hypothetical protein [Haloarcula rubripromontorii]|uniref:hypothetical protein n=1 Tax=Haloarcula rubripromontorii TaxID=1705562 RepID=UPI000AD4B1E7|nr:hypothetical protein [Haloarcula rubripromontorii]